MLKIHIIKDTDTATVQAKTNAFLKGLAKANIAVNKIEHSQAMVASGLTMTSVMVVCEVLMDE